MFSKPKNEVDYTFLKRVYLGGVWTFVDAPYETERWHVANGYVRTVPNSSCNDYERRLELADKAYDLLGWKRVALCGLYGDVLGRFANELDDDYRLELPRINLAETEIGVW